MKGFLMKRQAILVGCWGLLQTLMGATPRNLMDAPLPATKNNLIEKPFISSNKQII